MKRTLTLLILALPALITLAMVRPAEAATCYRSSARSSCSVSAPKPAFSAPQQRTDSILDGAIYGWIEDYARFYDAPEGQRAWQPSTGFFYGPAAEVATSDDGKRWYKVWGDWLPERYYHIVEASTFAGVEVNVQPQRPFGWVLRRFVPRPAPGAEPGAGSAELQRYDFVQVYNTARDAGGGIWYDVGQERWLRHDAVALLRLRQPPDGVEAGEYWVDVDLTQQTFAAYEGRRMVYAGLVSSGLPRWPTRLGLYTVWQRHVTTPMEGGERGDDYYYIDAVPHTMYFDGDIALHGAFWHDDFGRPKSHGCVNMPPLAAEWIYYWSEDAPNDLRVWVHNSNYGEFLQ